MQVRVIRARADQAVGDVVEMPDGAQFSDLYYEPAGSEDSSNVPDGSAPGGSEVSSKPPPLLITPDGPRPAEAPKAGM